MKININSDKGNILTTDAYNLFFPLEMCYTLPLVTKTKSLRNIILTILVVAALRDSRDSY